MPTTYAFVYRITNPGELAMYPDVGWQTRFSSLEAAFANLVIAAGLPPGFQSSTGDHAQLAFQAITKYFTRLKMQLLGTGSAIRTSNIEGLPKTYQERLAVPHVELVPTAMHRSSRPEARLRHVASLVDRQVGGLVLTRP